MRSRLPLPFCLLWLVPALCARAQNIIVVRGMSSTADSAEKAYVQRCADRTTRWLDALGLPHATLDDAQVSDATLRQARVTILPYNPDPPAAVLAALERSVARGNRLLVFYSASPRLGNLVGVTPGDYAAAPHPGHWTAFRFTPDAPRRLPTAVRQDSGNIRRARPSGHNARTIAWWHDEAGARLADAAWILSSRGAWMTHILTDSDPAAKRDLLLGLIAHFDPAAWEHAARAAARDRAYGAFGGEQAARQAILRAGQAAARTPAVLAALDGADAAAARMREALRQADWVTALDARREQDQRLAEAYARAQTPRAGEFRAAWEHTGLGLYPGDWPRTARLIERSGLNALFINVQWAGLAHYESRLLPRSAAFDRYGDQVVASVRAAHAAGLEAHAWTVCWSAQRAPAPWRGRMRAAGRMQVDAQGRTRDWLCPAQAVNLREQVDAILELAARAPVDGIHLDYVRYPDGTTCRCKVCRASFKTQTGLTLPAQDALPPATAERHIAWRATHMDRFVRTVRERLRATSPDVHLSAAVWGSYPGTIRSVGQDWGRWLREGWIDRAVPMNYLDNTATFERYLTRQVALPGAPARLVAGIGVTARESRLDAFGVIDQIRVARAQGVPGFALYQLDDTLVQEVLPYLRMGLTEP